MVREAASGIMLVLLSTGALILAFNSQPVGAAGTIYIRADGSVDPSTAPIQRHGDVYTFTDNVYNEVVVRKSYIIIDGDGYTIKGSRKQGVQALVRSHVNNVTIKNINVKDFFDAVSFRGASYNTFSGNNITNNVNGIFLDESFNNIIIGNNIIANNWEGIWLYESFNNIIVENNITNNGYGIYVECLIEPANNIIYHNNFIDNYPKAFNIYHEGSANILDDGYPSGGNYWSDYVGVDDNGDGLGDTSYVIDENNVDKYPLMEPWSPPPEPDLIITNISWDPPSPEVGEQVFFSYVIRNQGEKSTTEFTNALYIDDERIDISARMSLATKETKASSFTYGWRATASSHNIAVVADDLDEIDESDETNNKMLKFLVTGLPVAPESLVAESELSDVKLVWEPPSRFGSSYIKRYNIYRGISSDGLAFHDSVDGNRLEYLDDTVSANSLYYYRVAAVNSQGEGPTSDEVKCSSKGSIKGIETVVRFDSFKTSTPDPFTIQQNFEIAIGGSFSHRYWAQNIIMIWPLTMKMSGMFEVWESFDGVTWNWWSKPVSWLFTKSPAEDGKNQLTLRSKIDNEYLVMENDFARYDQLKLPANSYMIVARSPESEPSVIGATPDLVIGGNQFLTPQVSFIDSTSGHVDTYVRVGENSGTWLTGDNTVIGQYAGHTRESSFQLEWKSNGDFNYRQNYIQQGLWLEPNYLGPVVSLPSPPTPVQSSKAVTISLHSPANLSLYDSLGRHIGYNTSTERIDREIPEVTYLYSEAAQYMIIFNPSGAYRLLVTGTSDGNYTLEAHWRNETGTVSSIWNSTSTILRGMTKEYSVRIFEDKVVFGEKEPEFPLLWIAVVAIVVAAITTMYFLLKRRKIHTRTE